MSESKTFCGKRLCFLFLSDVKAPSQKLMISKSCKAPKNDHGL